MTAIKKFVFNSIQVNTYLLYDESGECIIIDAGCMGRDEENELTGYIEKKNLKPVRLLNTHTHVDHIAGNKFVSEKYNIPLTIHKEGMQFIQSAKTYGASFNFDIGDTIDPSSYINDGDIIKFGQSELKVIYTPGHANGSVCFYCEKDKFVIVGDVLFYGSIGRTDLPTGNYDLLLSSIKNKLFTLPDDTIVFTGHGGRTTIGHEKTTNPFLI
ncbi:MAG: MBL fold metallo-hydrolase [Bacteroidales bacterium]|jgi:glyoxylase-like metal-dependent hydrolase (beta-lactamase superfamily II)